MSMLSRRMLLDLQSHTKTSKMLRHGTKVKSLVPGMGRQVSTKVTCNEGKGMRKRETFRTSRAQAECNIFSRPSFSRRGRMAPSERRTRPAARNDLAVPSLCICLLFVSVLLLVCVVQGLPIKIPKAGSLRQWSTFLTTKKVLRYDACAVKSDFCFAAHEKTGYNAAEVRFDSACVRYPW